MGFRAANHCDTSAQTSGDSAADGSMNGVNTGSDIIWWKDGEKVLKTFQFTHPLPVSQNISHLPVSPSDSRFSFQPKTCPETQTKIYRQYIDIYIYRHIYIIHLSYYVYCITSLLVTYIYIYIWKFSKHAGFSSHAWGHWWLNLHRDLPKLQVFVGEESAIVHAPHLWWLVEIGEGIHKNNWTHCIYNWRYSIY